MRSMRFPLGRSRLGAAGNRFLRVNGALVDEGHQSARGGASGEQPTPVGLVLDFVDRQGAVDLHGESGSRFVAVAT
jgi:hypothetical protein